MITVIVLANLCTCVCNSGQDQLIESYIEEEYLSGRIGDNEDDLAYREPSEGEEGERIFTSVFALAPDGSIFLDDPLRKVIKQLSPAGELIGEIHLNTLIVDDIAVVDSILLAICYWNRPFIDLMTLDGKVVDSIIMPGPVTSSSNLYVCGNALLLRYYASGSGFPRMEGYKWTIGSTEHEWTNNPAGLSAETCGQYHTVGQSFDGISDTATIVSTAMGAQIRVGRRLIPIGIDRDANLFVGWLERASVTQSSEDKYIIAKFSPAGARLAQFHVRAFGMDHLSRVDSRGNLYIFDYDLNQSKWFVYKYCRK
jgi:hypothetical protein